MHLQFSSMGTYPKQLHCGGSNTNDHYSQTSCVTNAYRGHLVLASKDIN
jgi:hypothetical protein